MSVSLASGDWTAELRPEVGGSLSALRWRGVDILRPMPAEASGPLEGSCFPLVPYANRIRGGRFVWHGWQVAMPLNFLPQEHSLHGFGWQKPWRVASEGGFKAALEFSHDGKGAWPWAFHAEQRVRLGPQGCAISLNVVNRAGSAMPMGLGLHPYFRRRPETQVQFSARGMVVVDDTLVPTGDVAADDLFAEWEDGTALPGQLVDHCFTGWDGTVRITDDLGTITMTARGVPFLHVYAPPAGEALCFEPVSHTPDALNLWPTQMTVLPPGCAATLQMWIGAE
jgi:aldose 1-epimerase